VPFELQSPPSRKETPDPDPELKRERTASQNFQRLSRRISKTIAPRTVVGPVVGDPIPSQNFQRLARRISIGNRRAGSALAIPIQNVPGFKREGTTSTPISKDELVTDVPATGSPSRGLDEIAEGGGLEEHREKQQETHVPVPIVPP